MPFASLPTTAGDGVGAAVDVTTLNPSKTFTLAATQAPAGGLLLIEGSNDATDVDFVPVAKFDLLQFAGFDVLKFFPRADLQSLGPAIKTLSVWRRLRVRRFQVPTADDPPVVNVGADTASAPQFGTMVGPIADGNSALLDVSTFGNVKTIHVGGTMSGGTIYVEASQDGGTTFDRIARFDGPWGAPNLPAPVTVEAEFNRLRLVRVQSLPPVGGGANDPKVHVGADDITGGGPPPVSGVLDRWEEFAGRLLVVNNTDAAVTNNAPTEDDAVNPAWKVDRYNSGIKSGRMFRRKIVTGATGIKFEWTLHGSNVTANDAVYTIRYRRISTTPPAVVGAWVTLVLAAFPIPQNVFNLEFEESFTIGNGGGQIDVAPGFTYEFEEVREGDTDAYGSFVRVGRYAMEQS